MIQHPSDLLSPRARAYLGELAARSPSPRGMGDETSTPSGPAQFLPPLPTSGGTGGPGPSVTVSGPTAIQHNGWQLVHLKPSGSVWLPACFVASANGPNKGLAQGQTLSISWQPAGGTPVPMLPTDPSNPPAQDPTGWARTNGISWDYDVCPPRTAGWQAPGTVSYGVRSVSIPPCTQWVYSQAAAGGQHQVISNFTNAEVPHTPQPGDGPLTLVGTYSPCPASRGQSVVKAGYDGTWALGLFGKKFDVGAVLPGSSGSKAPTAAATPAPAPAAPTSGIWAPSVAPRFSFGPAPEAPPAPAHAPAPAPVSFALPPVQYHAAPNPSAPDVYLPPATGGGFEYTPQVAAASSNYGGGSVRRVYSSPSATKAPAALPVIPTQSMFAPPIIYSAPTPAPAPSAAPNAFLEAFAKAARTGQAPNVATPDYSTPAPSSGVAQKTLLASTIQRPSATPIVLVSVSSSPRAVSFANEILSRGSKAALAGGYAS